MYTNCDEVFKITIPAARIAAAKALKKKGFSQAQIAKSLGIAQPAVSKYLSGKYSAGIKAIEGQIEKRNLQAAVVNAVISGKGTSKISSCIDEIASNGPLVKIAMQMVR